MLYSAIMGKTVVPTLRIIIIHVQITILYDFVSFAFGNADFLYILLFLAGQKIKNLKEFFFE